MPRPAGLSGRASALLFSLPSTLAMLAATTLSAGCAAQRVQPVEPAMVTVPPASSMPTAPVRSGYVQPAPGAAVTAQAIAEAVRADTARAHSLPDGAALVVSVEAVTWRDGSIGCPQPGQRVTQAVVPGWRITVTDGARTATYHASRRGAWVLCPPGMAAPPLPGAATR